MEIRQWLYEEVSDIVGAVPVVGSGSVDSPTANKPGPLFIVIRSLGDARPVPVDSYGQHVVEAFWLYVHDIPGSFSRNIDRLLADIREQLPERAGAWYGGGTLWVSEVRWEGASADQFDDVLNTANRYGQVRITASRR